MPIKSLRFIMILNNFLILFLLFAFQSCTHQEDKADKRFKGSVPIDYFTKVHTAKCESNSSVTKYRAGDLVCSKNIININSQEKMKINFIVTNKNSDDPYEYGYQELHRYKQGKVIEKLKLRKDDDAFLEFAVFPFHPGSAIWVYELFKV